MGIDKSASSFGRMHTTITELYQEYEVRLRYFALNLCADPDRAEDLVQETFIRAIANSRILEQLNQHQKRSWLYRTLKNYFIDEQRADKREQKFLEQIGLELRNSKQGKPSRLSPEWFVQLPQHYQEVIYRRYYLGMTSYEIGRELGIPAPTVRSRIYLAIKKLRSLHKVSTDKQGIQQTWKKV
jgi:RNA polymerase sigma-70 factor (ECF subfamily)